jgi:hypothetical protein
VQRSASTVDVLLSNGPMGSVVFEVHHKTEMLESESNGRQAGSVKKGKR